VDRFDLGSHTMAISTDSAEAQRYFNLGLNWCYGFNQEEGMACFERAIQFDPNCALAHWGIAYARGPFYNNLWRQHSAAEASETTRICYEHIQQARALKHHCTDLENHLVEALACRFQKAQLVTPEEFDRWDDDYANAMRRVYYRYPNNHDVAALFAEAIMTRTAWRLWNVYTGEPTEGADTLEALAVIEQSIAKNAEDNLQQHPAILHLHIHATEMSNHPERAMASADVLSTLCPDAGHMNHMPGHTYTLCGQYDRAQVASKKAIAADQLYLDYAGNHNFYTTARAHDLHLMMLTSMYLGQFEPALRAAEAICETITDELLSIQGRPQMVITMEGYYSMKMHVLVRFGKWQNIIDETMPTDFEKYPVSIAMHHYARGVAYAFQKNFDAALCELSEFENVSRKIPESRVFFNNKATTILSIGENMLRGELAYHQGHFEAAFNFLRESVRINDQLHYSEPWPWMHPPRHALAALLLEQGHYSDAERQYRADLGLNDDIQRCAQHPNNVWALHGLVECLEYRHEQTELPQLKIALAEAMRKTDIEITSSCLCRQSDVQSTSHCCPTLRGE